MLRFGDQLLVRKISRLAAMLMAQVKSWMGVGMPIRMWTRVSVALMSLLVVGLSASANEPGWKLGLSFMKVDDAYLGPNLGNTEYARTWTDWKFGRINRRVYLGVVQESRSDTVNSTVVSRSNTGVTAGYHSGNWFIHGSYFFLGEYKLSSVSLTGVGGMGIDVGWDTQVTGKLYGGFQLSHRSLKYAKAGDNSADNQLRSELSPRLNLGILF